MSKWDRRAETRGKSSETMGDFSEWLVDGWLMCWWMTLMENLRNHQNGWLMVDGWLMCCICSTVALIYCNDFNDEMIG